MKTEIATWALVTVAMLGLVHCATPDIPGDEEGEASGRNESGSPAAKLPPASTDKAQGSTPASTPGAPGTPAQTPPGTPPVATCDLTKSFAAPVEVLGLPAGQHFATPRLSRDELTVYFTTRSGATARIARAVRPTLAAPFAAPIVLDAQSSTAKDNDPSVSADGATLWFSSERAGTEDKLYMAQLVAATGMFGAPQLVPTIGSTAADQHPYYRVTGGGELWFVSSRGGQQDIFVAKKNATGFDPAIRVEELRSTTASSRQPMVTEDGLTIVFSSARTGSIGGSKDLWTARRATATSPFGPPEAMTAINSAADEYAGWISNDGCRVYFSSDRALADTHRVYVAARPAK